MSSTDTTAAAASVTVAAPITDTAVPSTDKMVVVDTTTTTTTTADSTDASKKRKDVPESTAAEISEPQAKEPRTDDDAATKITAPVPAETIAIENTVTTAETTDAKVNADTVTETQNTKVDDTTAAAAATAATAAAISAATVASENDNNKADAEADKTGEQEKEKEKETKTVSGSEAVRRESAAGHTNFGRMGTNPAEQVEHVRKLREEAGELGFVKIELVSPGSGNADFYVPRTTIEKQTKVVTVGTDETASSDQGTDVHKPTHTQWELTQALIQDKDKSNKTGDDAVVRVLSHVDVDDEHTCPDFVRSIAKEEASFLTYNLTGAPAAELASLKLIGTIRVAI
jgi:hypothetical protein